MKNVSLKEIEARLFSEQERFVEEMLAQLRNDSRKGASKLLEKYERRKSLQQQERARFHEMMKYENELRNNGITLVAGIDEAGRGPLAGPVVASAVILGEDFFLPGLTDSKKLSKLQRERFYEKIIERAEAVAVHYVSAGEIDRINIYEATKVAMIKAVQALARQPEHLLIDAMVLPLTMKQTSLIKGDQKSASIAAASIVAKVSRDRYMEQLKEQHPNYHFDKHMGYATKQHLEAIERYGITNEHRRSFAPIKNIVAKMDS